MIFTKGGAILWSYHFGQTRRRKVDDHWVPLLIQHVFLEDKAVFVPPGRYLEVKWDVLNELDVVFVIAFDNATPVAVDELLALMQQEFRGLLPQHLRGPGRRDMTSVQTELLDIMHREDTRLHQRFLVLLDRCEDFAAGPQSTGAAVQQQQRPTASWKGGFPDKQTSSKSTKTPTRWGTQKVTRKAMAALDFSSKEEQEAEETENRYASSEAESEEESLGEATEPEGATAAWGFLSRIQSAIQNITGNKVVTEAELGPVLSEFRQLLMSKNVATEVAVQLADSVQSSLVGTKTESFTSLKTALRQALSDAIQRVLTQSRSIDVLKAAKEAKEKGRIYSVCFLGVNGVGKSTNLAKVAYYLKHKGDLNVLIAACDTFRAGAVEQLRTHARNLGVHLFEQGYGKDAALICRNAMKYAQAEGYDVVLVDTAGRMQDNEPLMRALAKLVALNNPDLVLFVGEALVGNDAIDQLLKFDRSLIDFAPVDVKTPRGIDGIILTKFDTVDDKVGAALSMAYISGQPVVFVGTGQKYTHLQTLNVNTVLNALLST